MTDPGYLDIPLRANGDPDALLKRALDSLADGIDGYDIANPGPEARVLDATAEMAAEAEELLVDVARAVFRAFAKAFLGLEALDAAAAVAVTTWTLRPAHPAFVIAAGTEMAIGGYAFVTKTDTPVAAEQAVVPDVAVVCVLDGQGGNDSTATKADLVDIADVGIYVESIAVTVAPHAGRDAESDDVFEDKAAARFRHLGRPTRPEDFAERAIATDTDVGRVLPLSGHRPVIGAQPAATGIGRCILLICATSEGLDCDPDSLSVVETDLRAQREQGWQIHARNPTRTPVAPEVAVTVWPGFDLAETTELVRQAVVEFLDPATWGAGPDGLAPVWHDEPIVLRSELSAALNALRPVRHVPLVKFNGADADVALAGLGPLPQLNGVPIVNAAY